MSYRYDAQHLSSQQQAIIKQRDREDALRKKEAPKKEPKIQHTRPSVTIFKVEIEFKKSSLTLPILNLAQRLEKELNIKATVDIITSNGDIVYILIVLTSMEDVFNLSVKVPGVVRATDDFNVLSVQQIIY